MTGPRIFYFCFDHDRRFGGPKQIYRHVTLLRQAGVDAAVVHHRRREPLRWFAHDARVIDQRTYRRRYQAERDLTVLPEDMLTAERGAAVLQRPGRKVIFNQNVYLGFLSLGVERAAQAPFADPAVVATLCVSEHNRRLLQHAFPRSRVLRVRYGVDSELFRFRPLARKRRWIACQVKAQAQLSTLVSVLLARSTLPGNPLRGYRFISLQGFTEDQLALVLEESAMLLALSVEEGFCLLTLEAMLAGCLVTAFAGSPMDEFLPAAYRHRDNDVLAAARSVEERARALRNKDTAALERLTRPARARAEAYPLEAERRSVLRAWKTILRGEGLASLQPALAQRPPRRQAGSSGA